LFLDTYIYRNTAWNFAGRRGNQDVLQKIWDFAKENPTAEDIKKMVFLVRARDGNTAWHFAPKGYMKTYCRKYGI